MVISEAQTHSELIDEQLGLAAWSIKDPLQVIKEFDILTSLLEGISESCKSYADHQFSDYVLLGKDGKPLILPVESNHILTLTERLAA